MEVKNLILQRIKEKGQIQASEITGETGFSRIYIHRFFDELQKEGKITKIGVTKSARYVLADSSEIAKAKKTITKIDLPLKNTGLNEDVIYDKIKADTGILSDLPKNIKGIVDFAFLEMLNNAIEHSKSENIRVTMARLENKLIFDVFDSGIGVFVSIRK